MNNKGKIEKSSGTSSPMPGRRLLRSLSVFQFTLLLLVFTALISIGLITITWIFTEKRSINRRIDDLKLATQVAQKENLKYEVTRVFNYIDYINRDSAGISIEERKANILDYLKDVRFGNDGYIFINTYYGQALLFDGQKTEGIRDISDLTDPQGLKIFEKELELAKLPEGGYFKYLFKKLNDTIPVPKISFIRGYDPWGWIIGTGDYLDNIDSEINLIEEDYSGYLRNTYLKVFGISFVILLILILIGGVVARGTQKHFDRLINLLKTQPEGDLNSLQGSRFYIRELRTIGLDIFRNREMVKNFGDIIERSRNEIYIFRQEDLRYTHANLGALSNCGYTLPKLKEITPLDQIPKKDTNRLLKLLDALKRGETDHVRLETTFLRKNGSHYPVEAHITATDFYQEPVFVAFIHDISKRKETEDKLVSSMQRYSGLFENAPISLWEEDYSEMLKYLDEQKKAHNLSIESLLDEHPEILHKCVEKIRVVDLNRQTLIMYEASSKEELTGNLSRTFTEESFINFKEIVLAIYNGKSHYDCESKNKTLKGRVIDVHLKMSLLSDDKRFSERVILSMADITELRSAEVNLKASEARFRSIFENNQTVMLLVDPKSGRFVDINPAALNFYGYSPEQFLGGMTVFDLNIKGKEEVAKLLKKAASQNNAYFDFQHRLASGEIKDVEVYTGLVEFGERELIFSIVHDATEKFKAREILKESKDKLESIFRAAPTGIGVVSNRIFTEVNQLVCEMVGYSAEELIGKESRLIYPSDEEFEKVGKLKYSQIRKSGTGTIETRFKRKDGKIIDVLLSSTPLDFNDFSKGVTFTALDITERKTAEKNLLKALNKAKESDLLKSSFLATMSHELRTPLNAIIGFSDFIDDETDSKDASRYAGIINTSGKHLLRLVEDILNISLIESGESKVLMENCKLESVLTDVYNIIMQERLVQGKENLELNMLVDPENKSLVLSTDQAKLKQILINLLKNALKFTPQGAIHFGFMPETRNGNSVVKFFVKDTGVGIPPEKSQLIFEMFRQADESFSRTFGGAGIGLSLSKKLTVLLGGDIWFDSEVGKGSQFYFTLPCDVKKEDGI